MLRVGLTGDLGSGKSTVARLLAARGARVYSSDEMARAMMERGQPAFVQIAERFGPGVLTPQGTLNRRALATLAFQSGRAAELEDIIHPAVLGEQARLLAALAMAEPAAIAVVESALIFVTQHDAGGEPWHKRFDRILLVTAPEDEKIARFIQRLTGGRAISAEERATLEQDARARLALQSAVNDAHAAECIVLNNAGELATLAEQVDRVWLTLQHLEASTR